MSRFQHIGHGKYTKTFQINGIQYRVTIPSEIWNATETRQISQHMYYYIANKRSGKHYRLNMELSQKLVNQMY
jgi:hypothetical protein